MAFIGSKRHIAAAERLQRVPGVLAVVAGVRRQTGSWTDEPVLSVYVRHKRARARLSSDAVVPTHIDGIATDVVGIGRPKLYADVDCFDRLEPTYDGATPARKSALTALAADGDGMLGLGSGHGLLPLGVNGYRSGNWALSSAKRVRILEASDGMSGFLIAGKVAHDLDFALVSFPGLQVPQGLAGHFLANPPIPWTGTRPAPNAFVQHVSASRGARFTGSLVGVGLLTGDLELGTSPYATTYTDILVVSKDALAFSRPSDSGSLVFNEHRVALGFVVGGTRTDDGADLTFVLTDFPRLEHELQSDFRRFFAQSPT